MAPRRWRRVIGPRAMPSPTARDTTWTSVWIRTSVPFTRPGAVVEGGLPKSSDESFSCSADEGSSPLAALLGCWSESGLCLCLSPRRSGQGRK